MSSNVDPDQEFLIVSDRAWVVSTGTTCWSCRAAIEVICIYCDTGSILGAEQAGFLVSNVTALDAALERQLARWPQYRRVKGSATGFGLIANHCHACGRVQQDYFLHCVPEGVFFSLEALPDGALEVWALAGTVRLSGDEGYEP